MVSTVTGFLVVRAIHGFSTGFTPTGFTAFTADVVAESHRGRAMGWQGMFNNLGTTIGYALGAIIAKYCGVDWMYYVSAALAATAWMMFMQLPETRLEGHKRQFQFSMKQLFYFQSLIPQTLHTVLDFFLTLILVLFLLEYLLLLYDFYYLVLPTKMENVTMHALCD